MVTVECVYCTMRDSFTGVLLLLLHQQCPSHVPYDTKTDREKNEKRYRCGGPKEAIEEKEARPRVAEGSGYYQGKGFICVSTR